MTDLERVGGVVVEGEVLLASPHSAWYEGLEGYSLEALEEISYHLAVEAGRSEAKMWEVLAFIRDRDLWKEAGDTVSTFRDYMADWLHEAARHCGRATPWSVSYAQKRLSMHNRLVNYFGADVELVLGASLDVMMAFCKVLSDEWHYKTGEPLALTKHAQSGLTRLYPDKPLREQVQAAVTAIGNIPVPGEALDFIKTNFGPPSEQEITYEWAVEVDERGVPHVRCKETCYNMATAEVERERWHVEERWPVSAVEALTKRLGAPLKEGS